MRGAVLVAFLVVTSFPSVGLGAELVTVDDPLRVRIPPEALRSWGASVLPAERSGPVPVGRHLVVPGRDSAAAGRIDILVRSSGGWRLASSKSWDGFLPSLPSGEERIGIVARFAGASSVFWWGETRSGSEESVVLEARKRVVVRPPENEQEVQLWVAGESDPRHGARTGSSWSFELVPVVPSAACMKEGLLSRCGLVPEGATELVESDVRAFRVVRAEGEMEVRAFAPGSTALRPRDAHPAVVRAGEWLLLGLPAEESWNAAVLDLQPTEGCPLRVRGVELAPLPAFLSVRPPCSCGLSVRPVLEPDGAPVADLEARMVFFDPDVPAGPVVARAVSSPDESGVFHAPDLPSGRYLIKLHSALVSSRHAPATLEAGGVETVEFEPGQLVRGRVVTSDGLPVSRQLVQIARLSRAGSAEGEEAGKTEPRDVSDVLDALRGATTGEDGGFAAGVDGAGTYELSVRSPRHRAIVRFAMPVSGGAVNLGDVVLRGGSVLRGSVSGCAMPAEVQVLPIPDLSAPLVPGDVDLVRAEVGPDGRFEASNLPAGNVLVAATCGGVAKRLDPRFLALAEAAVEIRAFNVVEPVPAP